MGGIVFSMTLYWMRSFSRNMNSKMSEICTCTSSYVSTKSIVPTWNIIINSGFKLCSTTFNFFHLNSFRDQERAITTDVSFACKIEYSVSITRVYNALNWEWISFVNIVAYFFIIFYIKFYFSICWSFGLYFLLNPS